MVNPYDKQWNKGFLLRYNLFLQQHIYNIRMNFIILFYDLLDMRYSLVGFFQTISSVSKKLYGHYDIHSIMVKIILTNVR